MYTGKLTRGLSILLILTLIFSMSAIWPYYGDKAYATEDEVTAEETVIEVSTWSELEEAFSYSEEQNEHFTIRLMKDLSKDARDSSRNDTSLVTLSVWGSHITFDFNGHTLIGNDDVSDTDLDYTLSDFITIYVHANDMKYGSSLRFIDSDPEGKGGIYMFSRRAYDTQLSALNVISSDVYYVDTYKGKIRQTGSDLKNELYFDGGTYKLVCETEKFGNGTVSNYNDYRGCVVVSDFSKVIVNDGTFIASGAGYDGKGDDMCARELTAFGTYAHPEFYWTGLKEDRIIINGGIFKSNGYAVHSFGRTDGDRNFMDMEYMTINGGAFFGGVGFVGGPFIYLNGEKKHGEKPASTIVKNMACGVKGNNSIYYSIDNMNLSDLHNVKSLYVIGPGLLKFNTTPTIDGEEENLKRSTDQMETFHIDYKLPLWWNGSIGDFKPCFKVTPVGGTTTVYEKDTLDIDYSKYPKGVKIEATLYAKYIGEEYQEFCNVYNIAVEEAKKPAEIVMQPQSCTTDPGWSVRLSVTANYGAEYNWYYVPDGFPAIKLDETTVSMLISEGEEILDYNTPNLTVMLNEPVKAKFYCEVTGTDGTKVKSNSATITFGKSPQVVYFNGGNYHEGEDVTFYLKTKYLTNKENVTFMVYDKKASSTEQKFYTLDEFTEATGIEVTAKVSTKSQLAKVTFHKVPASASGNYALGYQLSNTLGKTQNYDPETMLYFNMVPIYPEITTQTTDASCYIGETLEYTVAADEATSIEWRFANTEEETEVVYSVDEMKKMFPDVVFTVEQTSNTSELTIENAVTELNQFGVYALVVGKGTSIPSNSARIDVRDPEGFQLTGTLQGLEKHDGTIEVFLTDKATGKIKYNGSVDSTGEYVIDGIPAGEYTLTVKAVGYATYTSDIAFDLDNVELDIKLEEVEVLDTPTNVKVSNVASSGKPKVSWDAVEGADKYEVWRKIGSGGTYEKYTTTTSTSVTHTGAKVGKTYYYKVRAVSGSNADLKSEYTKELNMTCDLPQPTNFKVTTVASTGKPKVSWDKVEGADKYEVWRKIGSGGTYEKYTTTTGTSVTHTGAKVGKTYYYKVKAIYNANSYANSAFTKELNMTCDLPQPVNVKITTSESTGKPQVSWDKVSEADKYEIWRATSKDGTYSRMYTVTGTSYTNTSAQAGKTYYYKVKAVYSANSYATSAYSAAVNITCDLAQPTNVKVSAVASTGKPKVSWDKVEGADKYEVWRKIGSDGTYEKYTTTTGTTTTHTGAKVGKTYYYKVKAIYSANTAANSAYSKEVSMTCDLAQPKATVALTSAGKPKVSWGKVEGADKYEVWRKIGSDGTYEKYTTTTSLTATHSGAKAGKTYYYKVKAIYSANTAANSAYSNEVYITAK